MFVKNYLFNSVVGIFKPRTAHDNWQPTSKRAFFILMGLAIVLGAWFILGSAWTYLRLMVELSGLESLILLALAVVASGVVVIGSYWLLQVLVRKINSEVSLDQIRQGYSLFYTTAMFLTIIILSLTFLALWLLIVNSTAAMVVVLSYMLIACWWLCNRAHWLAAITGSSTKAAILPSFLYVALTTGGYYFLEFLILVGFAEWHQLPWPTFMQLFGAA